jgi:TP901 family phage tail tape measure protein
VGALPPVFIEFLGNATGFNATARGVRTELAAVETAGGGSMARLGAVSKAALLGIGVAAVVTAVKTVHMAADFQTAMTRVRTGAGEAANNMGLVSNGVLAMAGKVGESTKDLTSGLYMVESAGFHGSAALKVLETSAEGAKVGAADLATVTDAVTTAMNAYGIKAKGTTGVMNALVATEAAGKTNMEALAGSMSSILPVAASAHVGLNEVLGAMATMTMQGTSAKVAATYLRQTIGQLSNPTAKAADEMKSLGLNSYAVSKNLGKNGLASTLTMITDAIQKHMGPGGDVLIEKLKSASSNTTAFQKVLANLSPTQQTYIGALATMVGGTKSMMAALQLTGPHMATFRKNVQSINEHVKAGGKGVEGWADVQKTFNQRMAEAKGSLQAMGIQIGTQLMPAATQFIRYLGLSVGFLASHRIALEAVGIGLFALTAGLAVATVASWSFTDSILADPLTWIVVGIVALVAALVLLILHWRQVAAWLESAWSATVNGLVAAWHWLASETVSVWDNYIVGPVKRAWQGLASWFVGAWHTVTNPIVSGWHWLWNATLSVWNAIAGFFKKWWPLLLVIFLPYIAAVVAVWNHFHKQVFGTAKSIWNAVAGFFKAVWAAIAGEAKSQWAGIERYIIDPISSAISAVRGYFNSVRSWLSGKWGEIRSAASSVWGQVESAITKPLLAAYNYVHTKAVQIKSALVAQLTAARDALKSVGSWFTSIGKAIIDGIVSGVTHGAGALSGALKDAAGNALSDAKHFLGIHSPSRVFADQVGAWIPPGIAQGIRAAGSVVGDAVNAVTGEAVRSPSLSPALAVPVRRNTPTVHNVHIEVHGTVVSENQLRDTVQKEFLRLGARNSATWQGYRR